jgi:hypothetical protein
VPRMPFFEAPGGAVLHQMECKTIPPGGWGEGRVRIFSGVSGRNLHKMKCLLSRCLEIKGSKGRGFGAQKCNLRNMSGGLQTGVPVELGCRCDSFLLSDFGA